MTRTFYSVEYWHKSAAYGAESDAGIWHRSSGDFDSLAEADETILEDLQWRVVRTTAIEKVVAQKVSG